MFNDIYHFLSVDLLQSMENSVWGPLQWGQERVLQGEIYIVMAFSTTFPTG